MPKTGPLFVTLLLVLGVHNLCWDEMCAVADEPQMPAQWTEPWQHPGLADRPLQIVHGMNIPPARAGESQDAAIEKYLQRLQDYGLGGMVCNMPFQNYMQGDQAWKTLATAIQQCHSRGMVVWLYDEKGYPSGAAGGLVLQENSAYEALELAYDATQQDPFVVRPSYEFTHANNNYAASQRYVNLLDTDAIRCFTRKTHDAYWAHLQPLFGTTIQAMFTDEPSLLAVSLGQIPEESRKNVPLVDAADPTVKPLPAVPWCHDLPQQYHERFQEDLLAQRRSLFTGDSADDHRIRQQFWSLVADLIADRYFGQLQRWCEAHGVASSGHTLVEESLIHQVAVEGNALKALSRMQIPGLDMLSSDPEAVIHSGWLTAGLPYSAATLTGHRRVMTEVSDFSQKMGSKKPASLSAMQATAAWQATWGVTDFTLYYGMDDRSQEEYQAYGEFVGRLNAILKPATQQPLVLLYYPVFDLWSEYLPVANPLNLESQSERARRIVGSFMRMGQMLQRNQVPFALIDHEYLAAAGVNSDGTIQVGDQIFRCLLLPQGAQLPAPAAVVAQQARQASELRVLTDGRDGKPLDAVTVRASIAPSYSLAPASPRLAPGQFCRDGRDILLLVNVGQEAYAGTLTSAEPKQWLRLDPHNGSSTPLTPAPQNAAPLRLDPHQTCLLVD